MSDKETKGTKGLLSKIDKTKLYYLIDLADRYGFSYS